MKKTLMLVVVMLVVMSVAAFAMVDGSRHDLINGAGSVTSIDPNATLCGFCHIPHGGQVVMANGAVSAPLWARAYSKNDYTIYNSGGGNTTLSGTAMGQPGANSLTCLSCHDGIIGLGVTYKNGVAKDPITLAGAGVTANKLNWAYYNTNKVANKGYNPVIGGSSDAYNAGNDLRDDHPVGVVYDDANASLAGLDTVVNATATGLKLYDYGAGPQVECGSCHDPHNTVNAKFGRIALATLCQTCHALK